MSRRQLLSLFMSAAAACLLTVWPHPAAARLYVCNKTAHPASVALGFFDGTVWASAGWWAVAPLECVTVIEEPLTARYYYLYAEHLNVGGAWDGDRSFCVESGHFLIKGRENCLTSGYQVRGFFQVDTGDSLEWTENLAD